MTHNKKINPKSIGIPTKSYSQWILVPCGETNLLFVTGQLPQDNNGDVIHKWDPEAQTRLVFNRILAILEEVEMSFDDIVKVQIYIKDMVDAKVVSMVRDELLAISKPVSTFVEVSGFVKNDCCVEIDVVAAKKYSI